MPIAEEGLGLWSMEDTMHALHGKLVWKILSQDSLWTRMLLQKYGEDSVYEGASVRTISSELWRILRPHLHNLVQMSHWKIGKGDVSFRCACWYGEVLNPIFGLELTVKEGVQSIQQIEHFLTYEQLSNISVIEVDPHEENKLIFSLNSLGKFPISKSRVASPPVPWARYFWHNITTYCVNTFMWRLFQDALPFDYNILRKAIVLASKCVCVIIPLWSRRWNMSLYSPILRRLFICILPRNYTNILRWFQ